MINSYCVKGNRMPTHFPFNDFIVVGGNPIIYLGHWGNKILLREINAYMYGTHLVIFQYLVHYASLTYVANHYVCQYLNLE